MPWAAPDTPSIQIGLLTAIAVRAGLPVRAHSLHLEAAGLFVGGGIERSVYDAVVHHWWSVGLGEWIFTDPGAPAEEDADYVQLLRRERVPDAVIDAALRMRELTASFLSTAADEILSAHPVVVGFTTTFSQTVPSLALARLLKSRDPDVVVVFGGANCDAELGVALHRLYDEVDYVVQGDAERTFAGLCADLLAGRRPGNGPGVLARGGDGERSRVQRIDMSEALTPVYDEYFERLSRSPLRTQLSSEARLVIETSRGCWWGERHHCSFCGLNGSTMAFRAKTAEQVMAEIEFLARRHRRVDFDVVDNILDPTFFDSVLPELGRQRKAGHDYRFFFETKSNLVPDQVRQLREAGVHRIQPGIETLSTPLLRSVHKGVTAWQNVRLLVFAARYDLLPTWNIIYGLPHETEEDYAAMADLVPSLVHLKPPGLVRLQIHRFSPYFDEPAANGLRLVGPAAYYRFLHAVPARELAGLAYAFDYEHVDGHDPERAVAPLREAVEAWDRCWTPGRHKSLRYERGPGFLRIRDRRPLLPSRDIFLDDVEADLYLACLGGATPSAAAARLARDRDLELDADEVRSFLVQMADARLMLREGDWFLALALPLTPDADPPTEHVAGTVRRLLPRLPVLAGDGS
jgi:ribosomal peptide maturation radical SAM protein 1